MIRSLSTGTRSYRSERRRVLHLLKVSRRWLLRHYGVGKLSATLLYRHIAGSHLLIRTFVEKSRRSRSGREELRHDLFEAAGIPHLRRGTYAYLTRDEIIDRCRQEGWSHFWQLPSKLLARIYSQGWKHEVASAVPFSRRLFDAAGLFCSSRYELIARNILYEIRSVAFEVEKRYPDGSRARCDIWLTSADLWIEIWGFPRDTRKRRRIRSEIWGAMLGRYQRRREEKRRIQIRLGLNCAGVEVYDKSGQPLSAFEFARRFIGVLGKAITLPSRFHNPGWLRSRTGEWQMSRGKPPQKFTREALVRLKRCERALGIAKSVDWMSLCGRAQCEMPFQKAARSAGVPLGALSGIARLGEGSWQYTEPFNGERKRYADCAYGSPLIALSFAVARRARDKLVVHRALEGLPARIREYLISGARVGITGVAFLGFRPRKRRRRTGGHSRPRDYDTFVSSPIAIKLGLSAKVRGVSLKQRGSHSAAVTILHWLATVCGDMLILDEPFGRSQLVAKRRVAPSIWVLYRPSPEEINQLAVRVLRRVGLNARS
jgi:hypothetical protein